MVVMVWMDEWMEDQEMKRKRYAMVVVSKCNLSAAAATNDDEGHLELTFK